jgi:hypothetical protein
MVNALHGAVGLGRTLGVWKFLLHSFGFGGVRYQIFYPLQAFFEEGEVCGYLFPEVFVGHRGVAREELARETSAREPGGGSRQTGARLREPRGGSREIRASSGTVRQAVCVALDRPEVEGVSLAARVSTAAFCAAIRVAARALLHAAPHPARGPLLGVVASLLSSHVCLLRSHVTGLLYQEDTPRNHTRQSVRVSPRGRIAYSTVG